MKTYRNLAFYLLLLLLHTVVQADTSRLPNQQLHTGLWQDITPAHQARITHTYAEETQRRALLLNTEHLNHLIATHTPAHQSELLIEIPLPDGTNTSAKLQPVATLSTALQQRYPNIKTWRISSMHPYIVSGRAELTPGGLYIMLQSNDGDQWFTEPVSGRSQHESQHYESYSQRQSSNQQKQTFSCGTQHIATSPVTGFRQNTSPLTNETMKHAASGYALRSVTNMLSYDLAVSATAEYTQQFGGSVLRAYGAIVSTVNRVNAIYERELGITLQLVSGPETVFTDPVSDPFDNTSPLSLLAQNQHVLDTTVGTNGYDLGHVFSVSENDTGIARVGSLCQDSQKAHGLSAAKMLSGDRFIVDYVAHEIGHQLGATHTFNSNLNVCGGSNRVAETAFEPGSGSTIMSYAGLCGSDDIQQQALAQFHSGSVAQIMQNITKVPAMYCATQIALTNNPPVVTTSTRYTIPARTPFILHGLASDSDGDVLLYSWDQTDVGGASSPDSDLLDNALIKSSPLSKTSVRYVPAISALLNTTQTTNSGEHLPYTSRELNFRLSARDGRGAISGDGLKITVFDTGAAFRITHPERGLNAGKHAVHWQVAYTNQPPINCTQVDIAYSNDQGATFTDLIRQTPNDGGALIQLNESAEHIRVKCSNNTFFAISGTAPKIASYPMTPGQYNPVVIETIEEDSMHNGGGGTLPLTGVLLGSLFAMLMHIPGRRKPEKLVP